MPTGNVILVGAGPGDPGLLTLAGAAALAEADVVVYDRLVSPGVLARIPQGTETIDVGKESGHHPVPQTEINAILLAKAKEGKTVVRLKGGDPFLFGRGGEEMAFLAAHGVPFKEIPGIPSAVAAPAYAGIPATLRGKARSLHIFTAHAKTGEEPDIPFEEAARLGGTLVFLMGVAKVSEICGGLLAAGMPADTPAAAVENGTLPCQRRLSAALGTLAEAAREKDLRSPAVLVVGEVCRQAETLDWFSRLPLFGRRIALTMPEESARPLAARLSRQGAEAVVFPCIRIEERLDTPKMRQALARLSETRYLVFSSRRGIDVFFHALFAAGKDARALAACRIAAVGPRTAASLAAHGLRADIVPKTAGGAFLSDAVLAEAKPGKTVLLCRSAQGSPLLPERLREGGLTVFDVPGYETHPLAESDGPFPGKKPDLAVFASGTAIDGFLARTGFSAKEIFAVCIGKTTAAYAKQRGFSCAAAERPDLDSLFEAICKEGYQHGTH